MIRDFRNIQCRDAVLDYDRMEWVTDEAGRPVTHWDGRTMQPHPVTGEPVPDERAQVPVERYVNPRRAAWPAADFVVGNPPFIGAGPMRRALGNGYVEALRGVWTQVPESADYVMYWWEQAAELTRTGQLRRFGFITTNSLRQTFNRRVLERHLGAAAPLSLCYAVPDHPWVDAADGAQVRIGMTVGEAGEQPGVIDQVVAERSGQGEGLDVDLARTAGRIHADLRIGADVAGAVPLRANQGLSSPGVKLHGAGFIVTPDEAAALGLGRLPGLERHIRRYLNGRDLTQSTRGVMVIDLFGLTADEVSACYPEVYQRVLERVKPERDQNNRATYRDNWWVFGEPRRDFRPALVGLPRYIATVETAKHRTFVFLDQSVLPDNMLIAIALDDPWFLGVLSSRVHVFWALATGARLGVGNDPRYTKTRCFETFPFPAPGEPDKERVRHLAEALDAHRKSRQALHPGLTMTGMYNVLEQLRRGEPLGPKERQIHEQGLISVLRQLHDELDAAVLAAYGWEDLTAALGGGPGSAARTDARVTSPRASASMPVGSAVRTAPPTAPRLGPDSDARSAGSAVRTADPTGAEPASTTDADADADPEAGPGAGAVRPADPPDADRGEATILERLVALNAKRAAEERRGLIRWLRPALQHPGGLVESAAAQTEADLGLTTPAASGPKPAWPKTLPEQFQALRTALAACPGPTSAADLAQCFTRAPRARVAELLDTLTSLGHARLLNDGRYLPG